MTAIPDRDTIPGRRVTFRDGTSVHAVSLSDRREDHPRRSFGLYLDPSWKPTRPAAVIEWPDLGLPACDRNADGGIRDAFDRARRGQWIEVGCIGGCGRTGTVLACMAVLAGELPDKAVQWVRRNYDPQAVDTPEQETWVVTFGSRQRAWCYFCNLTHAVYREIRHIGPPGDHDAKCHVSDRYSDAAKKCQKNRGALKSSVPFQQASFRETDDVIRCYEKLTALTLSDLVDIFRRGSWQPSYGGRKWATITNFLIRLKQEMDSGAVETALTTCEAVRELRHNSGPLVPSVEEWRRSSWLREKWPVMCDGET